MHASVISDALHYGVLPLVLLVSALLWVQAARRVLQGKPVLEAEPRRPVPWGLIDLAMTLIVRSMASAGAFVIITRLTGAEEVAQFTDPRSALSELLVLAASSLAGTAIALAIVQLHTRADLSDLGLSRRQLGRDVRLGCIAFVMLAPPVYGLQLALVQWQESRHPLILLLQRHPQPALIAGVAFSAVLVAPLVEEILFRLLLQGWLEKVAWPGKQQGNVLLGDVRSPQPQAANQTVSQISSAVTKELPAPDAWHQGWPILASATLFGLAHWDHGPDPIPLFVLALGLGYLYQRTHRITPCIIVHLLLNMCTVGLLLLQLLVLS